MLGLRWIAGNMAPVGHKRRRDQPGTKLAETVIAGTGRAEVDVTVGQNQLAGQRKKRHPSNRQFSGPEPTHKSHDLFYGYSKTIRLARNEKPQFCPRGRNDV